MTGLTPGNVAGLSANNFGVSTPSGYTPVAVAVYSSGHSAGAIYQISAIATGSGRMMSVRNIGSANIDLDASISILYVKTAAI